MANNEKGFAWLRQFSRFGEDSVPKHTRLDREFEGFEAYTVLGVDGSLRQEYRYTGVYHKQMLSRKRQIFQRISYTLLFLCTVALFLFAGLYPAGSNRCAYVLIFECAAVVLMIFEAVDLAGYCAKLRPLQNYEYRHTVLALRRSSGLLSLALVGMTLASAVYYVLHPQEETVAACVCVVGAALAFGASAAIYLLERQVQYSAAPQKET